MKKVIFCAVALMMGAVGLAQTTPVAPGAPTNAQSLTPQGPAPASANMSHSIQNGNDNKVAISQVGTKQGAYTDQADGTGSGGNQGRIRQEGNVGPNSGVANMAELYQRGTDNQSTQYQFGDKNEALVKQGNLLSGSDGNRALIQQGATGAQQGEKNKAEITQNGNDNQARTQQRYDKNEALTNQFGNGNYADIGQNAQPNGSMGHAAEIGQTGLDNDAWIRQEGNGARNEATALQLGDNNFSWQEQDASASGGMGNNAYVAQGLDVRPNPIAAGLYLDLLSVDVINNGSLNSLATNAKAFQFQDGDDNVAASLQFGDGNYSEQHQDGDDNHALVVQNAFGNPAGNSNYAKQTQTGDDNEAAIGQNGMNQRALQSQIGDKNKALSTQRGHDNDVNIHQRGDKNFASTGQRGQCNDALVVQYDGQSAVVEQNLVGGLPGGNNTANIYQSGPNGGGGAIGCGFDTQLPMPPQVDVPIFDIPDICPGC
ncbi:MAG: curlin [Aequorivita sp.]|nr:curlin [Aequorivita sp.]HAV55202.1 curlin [Aequorivita sp.]|tara:strand:- start:5785 stop:7239 length:1455 start_codon:yes stop_codon:yes gene_type:complete